MRIIDCIIELLGLTTAERKNSSVWSSIFEERRRISLPPSKLKRIVKGQLICTGCGKKLAINHYEPLSISRCQHCQTPNFIPKQISRYWLYAPVTSDSKCRIYKAVDASDVHTDLVVKILPEGKNDCQELVDMLNREIEIGSQVGNHPHFIKVLDWGCDGGENFVVMESVDGIRLDMVVESSQRLPEGQLLSWALQIVRAENHLYDKGYLYRNIQPKNIIIDADGNVRLGNYCLAEDADRVREDHAYLKYQNTANIMHYMAPERIKGENEGQCSEIYSLGMLMFQLLTHEQYFQSADLEELAQKHLSPLRMDNLQPRMPAGTNREFIEILKKMVKCDPGERYQNYSDVGSDLFRVFDKYYPDFH